MKGDTWSSTATCPRLMAQAFKRFVPLADRRGTREMMLAFPWRATEGGKAGKIIYWKTHVNPGLINHNKPWIFNSGEYSSNSHSLLLEWYPPN